MASTWGDVTSSDDEHEDYNDQPNAEATPAAVGAVSRTPMPSSIQ